MFCRVALHEKVPGSVASDGARNFRAWVKGLPGFVGGPRAAVVRVRCRGNLVLDGLAALCWRRPACGGCHTGRESHGSARTHSPWLDGRAPGTSSGKLR